MLELIEQTFEKLGTRTPTMQEYWQAIKNRQLAFKTKHSYECFFYQGEDYINLYKK